MTDLARFVLFPGRHHVLTRFQAAYLRTVTEHPDIDGAPVAGDSACPSASRTGG